MIPRLKPYLGKEELLAALRRQEDAVVRFEEAFARTFEARYAIAFPYGRSGLWAFFKALGIKGSEVIMPAYTCVVVAHAIVLSGNIPRFVGITLYDYNMDLDQMEAVINERTQAIIATHLFGYPLNVDRLSEIVRAAEAQWGHKIWVIQDCAHAFGARWQGKLVCNEGDMALYGLNISNVIKSLRRRFYLLAVYPAFNERLYGLVNWLQEETPLLDHLTKAYHLDEKIHFPPDYLDQMLDVEAQVGLAQLRKYPEIERKRQENACYYHENLPSILEWELPPLVDGATYSHYVVRVPDRVSVLKALQAKGIQLGQLIEYSVPHMLPYRHYAKAQHFPNSLLCSRHTINLPIYPTLQKGDLERIVSAVRPAVF